MLVCEGQTLRIPAVGMIDWPAPPGCIKSDSAELAYILLAGSDTYVDPQASLILSQSLQLNNLPL